MGRALDFRTLLASVLAASLVGSLVAADFRPPSPSALLDGEPGQQAGVQRGYCGIVLVTPSRPSDDERALTCRAVEKAKTFFATYGLGIKDPIRLRFQREPLDATQPHLGAYAAATHTIRLLGLDQITGHHALFGLPVDHQLYESVIVHELAHAIAAQHFTDREPAVVYQEYLAYVAQISTMAPDLKNQILLRHDVSPFNAMDELSWTYYAMAPSRFGVQAYRHFILEAHPQHLISRLLSGNIPPPCPETE